MKTIQTPAGADRFVSPAALLVALTLAGSVAMTSAQAQAPALGGGSQGVNCTDAPAPPQAPFRFRDITCSSLGFFTSETWGVSIGDYNGDFWSDVFIGNHRQRPTLYRNNGDGTFTDVTLTVDEDRGFLSNRFADHHGAAFGDFNNDGFDDIQVATNGASDAFLGVSDGTFLSNESSARGTSADGSGWAASWLDINRDNRIDLGRWSFDSSDLRLQNSGSTFSSGPSISCVQSNYGQIADVTGDGITDLICGNDGTFPRRVYDYSNGFPQQVSTSNGLIIGNSLDTVIADLDGDLENEILSVTGAIFPNQAMSVSANRAEAFMDSASGQGNAQYFFSSNSSVTFTVYGRNVNGQVTTVSPGSSVTLNAGGIANDGRLDVSSSGGQWTVNMRSNTYAAAYIVMESSGTISNVAPDPSELRAVDFPILPRLLNREGGNWINRTSDFGFNRMEQCAGVVAADLDNDMDLDVYMSCRGTVENKPNRIYRNNGNGTFSRINTTFGGEGPVGVGLESRVGSSENVVTVDYDNDGYLDLFVTNGLNEQPLRVGGPHKLFRNLNSGNNWVQVRLVGAGLNGPAVGARVLATAGGVTQLREQNGGIHRWSQNDQRLHFGLANNSSVSLTIQWPNGGTQTVNSLAANRIYEIVENGAVNTITPGGVAGFPSPSASDMCGAPTYLSDLDFAVFLYQTNCGSNDWQIRVTGGQPGAVFTGRIAALAGGSISNVTPVQTEGNDNVTASSSLLTYQLTSGPRGVDGFNVRLTGDTCISVTSPSVARTLVGSRHLPVPSTGFNPRTRQTCSTGGTTALLSVGDLNVNENAGTASVTVTRSGLTSSAVSVVAFTRADGTAQPGSDFYGASGTLQFASGVTSRTFNVTILNDSQNESSETFSVRLNGASNATIDDGVATVTIEDDDTGNGGTPAVSIQNRTFNESVGLANVPITLSRLSTSDVTVRVNTIAGSATGGQDYFGFTRTVTIPAGSLSTTVAVTILNDSVAESTESLTLRLFSPTGAVLGSRLGTLTINDDD